MFKAKTNAVFSDTPYKLNEPENKIKM